MNNRQQQLLQTLVQEYIDRIRPVSSGFLADRFRFSLSPATIRHEIVRLVGDGYVRKMYYSSGSVPTNRAYRFFVEQVLKDEEEHENETASGLFETYEQAMKFLARRTSAFSALIDEDMNIVFDGVEELFSQPDFSTREHYRQLARLIDDIQDMREQVFMDLHNTPTHIHIGDHDMMIGHNDTLSCIAGSTRTANDCDTVLFMIGPVRMQYGRNWKAFRSVKNRLAKSRPRAG